MDSTYCTECGQGLSSANEPHTYDACLRWLELVAERDAARAALASILDELSNGVTANWDYIAKRFAEGLGDTNVSV